MDNGCDFNKEHLKKLLEGEDVTPSMYINDISKIFNTTVFREAERMDMFRGNRRILFYLAHNDSATQLELSKATHLTPPTISVALSKMEKEGLVKRVADKKDMRQVKVYLTEKGKERNDFVLSVCKKTEEKMLNGISDEEQKQLCIIMRKILSNLL